MTAPQPGPGVPLCLHPDEVEGVCTTCGHCNHDVVLNGACFLCGATDLDPIALSPKRGDWVSAQTLRRKTRLP